VRVLSAALLALAVHASAAAAPLTIEQLVEIRHPSQPAWSPDGLKVVYLSERAGQANVFVWDGTATRALTTFGEGAVGAPFWSADNATVYFQRDGDLWHVAARGGEPRATWRTPAVEVGVIASPDRMRVAFVRGAELWTRSLTDGSEKKIAEDAVGITNPLWSSDGAHIGYSAGSKAIRHDEAPEYSGAKIIYTTTERTPAKMFVVSALGGTPTPIVVPPGFGGGRWIDAAQAVIDRQGSDFKKRTIVAVGLDGSARTLYEETDAKFWSIPGQADAAARPSPDGKWIAFVSDRDGWDHIYVVPAAGGEPIQVTKGKFEAWRPSWSPDSTRIAFDANEAERPGTRHVGIATIGADPRRASVALITKGRGTNVAASWSPDGKHLVYQHTGPQRSADLFVVDAAGATPPVAISESMPAAIDRTAFIAPELVHYPGPDGQPVPGYLFVPKGLDRTRKHPAIVWIHGDGINQNYDGWHVQRNYAVYYSFHQYLLQKGYVVFAPDYRGSIGYGRAWRQGVYMDVGGNDAKDAWMAAHYLKTLGYVDMNRIGVWGLSYGGFFTLIAMTDQPRLYRAGVNVAGVADYAMYYKDPYRGAWTTMRIGTPEESPKVYAQASPVSKIDRLERPLLTLHGTADINVPYLHAVRIMDEALKQGKGDLVEFMMYPGEFHYFTREHVLLDAWHRVERFFDRHLRGSPRT
jgi:dipeptidyl aminopeptidase/acylaminoacyl peptidase